MLQDGKPDSSNCTLGRVQLNIPTSHVGNAPATVPVKSISAQRHKSQYGRNPSGHCEIGRRLWRRGLQGSEGVGPDASGARKLKLAYEISVRGAWTVGGCDIKPRATLFGSTGDAWWCRTHTGRCTIRKEA